MKGLAVVVPMVLAVHHLEAVRVHVGRSATAAAAAATAAAAAATAMRAVGCTAGCGPRIMMPAVTQAAAPASPLALPACAEGGPCSDGDGNGSACFSASALLGKASAWLGDVSGAGWISEASAWLGDVLGAGWIGEASAWLDDVLGAGLLGEASAWLDDVLEAGWLDEDLAWLGDVSGAGWIAEASAWLGDVSGAGWLKTADAAPGAAMPVFVDGNCPPASTASSACAADG
eukprot:74242-Chlamydomonas_euryale.AAC.1